MPPGVPCFLPQILRPFPTNIFFTLLHEGTNSQANSRRDATALARSGALGTSGEQLPPSPWFRFASKSAANLRLQRESRESGVSGRPLCSPGNRSRHLEAHVRPRGRHKAQKESADLLLVALRFISPWLQRLWTLTLQTLHIRHLCSCSTSPLILFFV